MGKKYRISESWGNGSHYIGTMELQDVPDFLQDTITQNPGAGSWQTEIPDADGLMLVATIADD